MATSLQPEGMRDELSCSVCLELFKNPMTLPCEHSLCEECLKKIERIEPSSTSISVDCPLCRRTFQLQNIKKNHVLTRIIEVYKEDTLRRSQSCSDLSGHTPAPKRPSSSSNVMHLQQTPEFCKPFVNSQTDHAPATLRKSVIALRETFTHCERTEIDEADCLTQCTEEKCTDPPGRAVVLCATCSNQFCRVCWGRDHDLEQMMDHDINVYLKAFREPDGKDILCSVCDPLLPEKAKYICFHCNINFCQNCYKLTHPEIKIHHYIVKRPEFIPEQTYCSCCMPRKIATSICSICNEFYFCKRCLIKASNHRCCKDSNQLNGTASMDRHPISDKQIKNELFKMMQLRKQIVQQIPTFAFKEATRGQTDLIDGDRVSYSEDGNIYKCTVRWIGKSQDNVTDIVGVEFDDPVGTGDGAYNGGRKFTTLDGHAGFIDPIHLIRLRDYNPKASVDVLCQRDATRNGGQENGDMRNGLEVDGDQAGDLETDGVDFGPNPDAMDEDLQIYSKLFSNNLLSSSLEDLNLAPAEVNNNDNLAAPTRNQQPVPKPRKKTEASNSKQTGASNSKTNSSLKIGDIVAFFHGDSGRLCKGVVKWIGVLPDADQDKTTVGVEFDEAIGSGTGKYRTHRLFYAKMNHASLIPIEGLLKYEDVC